MSAARPKVLIQLDPDKHASSFDALVAIDSSVDQLLQYAKVEPKDVRNIVYGAIFTRGSHDLKNTAIFVGGAEVAAGEALLNEVTSTFFGPLRVSVMMDTNGCNTTATAAVVVAGRHVKHDLSTAVILAGTGPVGQRIAKLLAAHGTNVRLASRSIERAKRSCESIMKMVPKARLQPIAPASDEELVHVLSDAEQVYCAGTTGVQLLAESVWRNSSTLKIAIDLNAVPPLGIERIKVQDAGVEYGTTICYGALGVGATKMKIHREAIRQLFTDNSLVLNVEQIYEIGKTI